MKAFVKFITATILVAAMLGGGLATAGVANAAAAAKPATCKMKSGGTSADGTIIGTWKCEHKLWHKIPARTYAPFFMDVWAPMAAKSK